MALKGKAQRNRVQPSSKKRKFGVRRGVNQNPAAYLSLSELFDRYMALKKTQGWARLTIQGYYTHYNWFIDYLEEAEGLPDLMNEDITSDVFLGYVEDMADRGLAKTTMNVRIRTTRAFLRWCYEEGHIAEPIHEKFKPVKVPNDHVDALTPDEVKRLLNVIDDTRFVGFREITIILTALDTMARISEIVAMKRDNVDLREGTVRLEADDTKSKRTRVVPLSPHSLRYLHEYMIETEDFMTDHLFVTYDGLPLDAGTFRKRLTEIKEEAGITSKRVSPHVLRHTGALLYILDGGDPFSLQQILGHTDASMVKKYVNMADSDLIMQHRKHSPLNSVFDRKKRR